MKNYQALIAEIEARQNPERIQLNELFKAELSSITYGDVEKYIRFAMNGVEPEYTARSREAGEKVKKHLQEVLNKVCYEYQGSVMTNTHIKATSDIDLLVICEKFYSWDSSNVKLILENHALKSNYRLDQVNKLQAVTNASTYKGRILEDLRQIRIDIEDKLKITYEICDTSHPKAIKIRNKNLKRDVDIVVSNWYHNVATILNENDKDYKGIQIYNKDSNTQGPQNFPFLSIKRINERSSFTNGRLKKMIRFLKNIKAASSAKITLSSFQFNAICYDISTSKYEDKNVYELAFVVYSQLCSLANDSTHRSNLKSVDGNEFIDLNSYDKLEELKILIQEIEPIIQDLIARKAI